MMSRHLLAVTQRVLGKSCGDMANIFAKLAKIDPTLAKRLRNLDFLAIKKYCAEKALKSAAEELDVEVHSSFDTSFYDGVDGKLPPKDKTIGVLRSGRSQLGIAMSDEGKLSEFHDGRQSNNRDWKECFEKHYRREAAVAAMRLVSAPGTYVSEREVGEDVVLSAELA